MAARTRARAPRPQPVGAAVDGHTSRNTASVAWVGCKSWVCKTFVVQGDTLVFKQHFVWWSSPRRRRRVRFVRVCKAVHGLPTRYCTHAVPWMGRMVYQTCFECWGAVQHFIFCCNDAAAEGARRKHHRWWVASADAHVAEHVASRLSCVCTREPFAGRCMAWRRPGIQLWLVMTSIDPWRPAGGWGARRGARIPCTPIVPARPARGFSAARAIGALERFASP